jgi:hypothetical protein
MTPTDPHTQHPAQVEVFTFPQIRGAAQPHRLDARAARRRGREARSGSQPVARFVRPAAEQLGQRARRCHVRGLGLLQACSVGYWVRWSMHLRPSLICWVLPAARTVTPATRPRFLPATRPTPTTSPSSSTRRSSPWPATRTNTPPSPAKAPRVSRGVGFWQQALTKSPVNGGRYGESYR